VPPRPEIIDRLFEARYEYETALFETKAQAEVRYVVVLLEAAAKYNCAPDELRHARWLTPYYRDWQIQEKLKKPRRA
jgi:isopentenyldiphosphate isomerase